MFGLIIKNNCYMRKYSKKEITRAGQIILSSKLEDEIDEAYNKISAWRSNHLQPLMVMKRSLEKELEKLIIF